MFTTYVVNNFTFYQWKKALSIYLCKWLEMHNQNGQTFWNVGKKIMEKLVVPDFLHLKPNNVYQVVPPLCCFL